MPLDFSWPLNKVWGGYRNPFSCQSIECPDCGGSGSSPEYRHLHDQWYGNAPFGPEDRGSTPFTLDTPAVRAFAEKNIKNSPGFYGTGEAAIVREAHRLCGLWNKAWIHHLNDADVGVLVKNGRLRDLTHSWTKGKGWELKEPPYIPTAREVNEWSIGRLGHDSVNCWLVVTAECVRLGYRTDCNRCNGEGTLWPTPNIKQQYDDWKSTEPPAGEGYQLWETVSEGSPISPVFETPEELADYLIGPDYSWVENDSGTTREQWLAFIKGPGWDMSGVLQDGVFMNGVQAATRRESLDNENQNKTQRTGDTV